MTKSPITKSEQLLRIDDHDFTMRPAFGGENTMSSCQLIDLIDSDSGDLFIFFHLTLLAKFINEDEIEQP